MTTTIDTPATPASLRAERDRLLARRPNLALLAVRGGDVAAAAAIDQVDRQVADLERRIELCELADAEAQREADIEHQRQQSEAEQKANAAAARAARQWVVDAKAWQEFAAAGRLDLMLAKQLVERAVALAPQLGNISLCFSEFVADQMRLAGLWSDARPNAASLTNLVAAIERLAEPTKGT